MIFKDNLEKMYHAADFDKPQYLDEVYSVHLETREENKYRNDTPAHTIYPGYPHIENTTFSALEILAAMRKSGFSFF